MGIAMKLFLIAEPKILEFVLQEQLDYDKLYQS